MPMALFQLLWAGETSLSPCSAPNQLFELLRCSGRLIFRKSFSAFSPKRSTFSRCTASDGRGKLRSPLAPHRNVFSRHSGVTVGLFSEKALQLFLQNARPLGSLRSPYDAAPKCFFKTFRCYGRLIFRKSSSAFSPKRSTFRFASLSLRWAGEASLPPAPLSPAPEERERTGRRKAHSTG